MELQNSFIKGADVSHLLQLEDFGAQFYDNGIAKDCLHILKDHGFNAIRIKVWNDPGNPLHFPANQSDPHGYNDKSHAVELAARAFHMGFRIMIDFHYSDWWADPAKQYIPHEWQGLALPDLKEAVYQFTCDVLSVLQMKGVTPEWVQIGNEITNGMMWHMGSTSNWNNLAELLKQGYRAVKTVNNDSKVVLHLDQGGNNEITKTWFDNAVSRGVPFDTIGLSFYPNWHGSLDDLQHNMHDLAARYDTDIIIAETAYPWTAQNGDPQENTYTHTGPLTYEMSPAGQTAFLQELVKRIKACPDNKGIGFFYWEPEMIPVPGAGWKLGEGDQWDNVTLFDFHGNALSSLHAIKDY
jgi:arabinogalactan endo-1,4-beta-galactosidase